MRFAWCIAALCLASASASASQPSDFYHPFSANLADSKTFNYTVKDGENLFQVAERFLGSPYRAQELAEMNGVSDPLRVPAGSRLKVPMPHLGIRYWVEKVGPGGELTEMRPSARFEAGDQFQLRLAANWNGYLYVFNRDGSGEVRRVIPQGSRPMRLHAFTEYLVPGHGVMKLDAAEGDEELWVIVSEQRLPDLDALLDSGLLDSGHSAKARQYMDDAAAQKNITVSDDDEDADEPDTRVSVDPAEGKLLLAHRIVFKRR